jgi:hypothetical protein
MYDGQLEKPLRMVATEVRRSRNTVNVQYKSAFSLIFGIDYTPLDWWRLVARHKWPCSKYKGWRNPKSSAQVRASRLPDDLASYDHQEAVELRDMAEKAKELDADGVDHCEIARRLGIETTESEAEQIVTYLLKRQADL